MKRKRFKVQILSTYEVTAMDDVTAFTLAAGLAHGCTENQQQMAQWHHLKNGSVRCVSNENHGTEEVNDQTS